MERMGKNLTRERSKERYKETVITRERYIKREIKCTLLSDASRRMDGTDKYCAGSNCKEKRDKVGGQKFLSSNIGMKQRE